MEKKSRSVTVKAQHVQEMSCDEFAATYSDLVITDCELGAYTDYPFWNIILVVDKTALS